MKKCNIVGMISIKKKSIALWYIEKGQSISTYTVSCLSCYHPSISCCWEAQGWKKLPLSTYAGGGRETKESEASFHDKARSFSFSIFFLPILGTSSLSSNPKTPPQWLPFPKDTMTSILLTPIDLFCHVTGMPLMSTSLNLKPRVPQVCSLSPFPHLSTHTLQQASSYRPCSLPMAPSKVTHATHNATSAVLPLTTMSSFRIEQLLSLAFQWSALDHWMLPLYLFVDSTTSSCLLSVGFPRLGPSPILFSHIPVFGI